MVEQNSAEALWPKQIHKRGCGQMVALKSSWNLQVFMHNALCSWRLIDGARSYHDDSGDIFSDWISQNIARIGHLLSRSVDGQPGSRDRTNSLSVHTWKESWAMHLVSRLIRYSPRGPPSENLSKLFWIRQRPSEAWLTACTFVIYHNFSNSREICRGRMAADVIRKNRDGELR